MAQTSEIVSDLMQEIREQKNIAQQAKYRRSHCGKSGPVRLPSDNLTHKQWEAKNGECKTYCMNEPMTWEQFKELPDDLKVMYIKAIRKKYQTPDCIMAIAMDVPATTFSAKMRELGIGLGRGAGAKSIQWFTSEHRTEFENWWYKKEDLPLSGAAKFEAPMDHILNKLNDKLSCLGDRKVCMVVNWTVMED